MGLIAIPDAVYDVFFTEFSQELLPDGTLGPLTEESVVWRNARVLACVDGGDLIVQHPTGIRGAYPRIDRIEKTFLHKYTFRLVETAVDSGDFA